jgi:hypothetical protein
MTSRTEKWMCRLRGIEARFALPAFAGMTDGSGNDGRGKECLSVLALCYLVVEAKDREKWMCRLRGIEARFALPAFAGMTDGR